MRNVNKETGATLVMTLMIITVILLFLLTLFYQITNTTKQVKKMEHITVSEQIAEMGIDYYRAYAKTVMPEVFENQDEVTLPNIPLQEKVALDSEDGHYSFWIKSHSLTKVSESEMLLTFVSVGEAYEEVSEVESSIRINVVESGE
jgi:hypothetical protein